MEIKDMQKEVDEWIKQHKLGYFPPFQLLAQLQEELGEVAREVAHIHGHKKKKEAESTDGLQSEVGDVLFALCTLANSEGFSLEESFKNSMDKKYGRDKDRFEKN